MRCQSPEPEKSKLTCFHADGRNVSTPQRLLPRAGECRDSLSQTLSHCLLQDPQWSPTRSCIVDRPLLTSTRKRSTSCKPHSGHASSASYDGPTALPAEPGPVGSQGLLAPRPEQLANYQFPTSNGPSGICPASSSLSECSRTTGLLSTTGAPWCGSSWRCSGQNGAPTPGPISSNDCRCGGFRPGG